MPETGEKLEVSHLKNSGFGRYTKSVWKIGKSTRAERKERTHYPCTMQKTPSSAISCERTRRKVRYFGITSELAKECERPQISIQDLLSFCMDYSEGRKLDETSFQCLADKSASSF